MIIIIMFYQLYCEAGQARLLFAHLSFFIMINKQDVSVMLLFGKCLASRRLINCQWPVIATQNRASCSQACFLCALHFSVADQQERTFAACLVCIHRILSHRWPALWSTAALRWLRLCYGCTLSLTHSHTYIYVILQQHI